MRRIMIVIMAGLVCGVSAVFAAEGQESSHEGALTSRGDNQQSSDDQDGDGGGNAGDN